MYKARIGRFLSTLAAVALFLTVGGCDRGLEGRIMDTVFTGLRIADIWV